MSFLELAARRRTVHKYVKSEIPHEWVTEALSAALLAPNHRQTDPWHFVVVGRETRQKIAERVFEIKKAKNPLHSEEDRKIGLESFLNPAALVVFAQKRSESEFQSREDYATISCAIQNFCLSLAERGLGTKWSTSSFTTDVEIYKLCAISEVQFEIVGFVWAGSAAGDLSIQRRPYLTSVLQILP